MGLVKEGIINNNINEYKNELKNGVLQDNFIFGLELPPFFKDMVSDELLKELNVMVNKVNFPESRQVNKETIKYKGKSFNIPVSKGDYSALTIEFNVSNNFKMYQFFEVWLEVIQSSSNSFRESESEYKSNGSYIEIYAHDMETVLDKKVFTGLYPLEVSSFDLSTKDENILSATVTFSLDSYNSDID